MQMRPIFGYVRWGRTFLRAFEKGKEEDFVMVKMRGIEEGGKMLNKRELRLPRCSYCTEA